MGKVNWATKDPYGLAFSNAMYVANEMRKINLKARTILETDKVAKAATTELSDIYTDWDLGCVALALFDIGWEPEEVSEFLTKVQNKSKEVAGDGITSDDIWDKVREKGLDIRHE